MRTLHVRVLWDFRFSPVHNASRLIPAAFGPGGSYVGYADHTMKSIVHTILGIKEEQVGACTAVQAPPGWADLCSVPQGALFGPIWKLSDGSVRSRFFPPGWAALAKRVSPVDAAAFAAAAEAVALEANAAASPETLSVVRSVATGLAPTFARRTGGADSSSSVLAILPPIAARYAGHRAFLSVTLEAGEEGGAAGE